MKQTSTTARGLLKLDAEMRRQFEELARQEEPSLLATALLLCGDPVEAQDLVQDTLECALHSFPHLRLVSARAWLGTVLRHRFIDLCRRPKGVPLDEEHVASVASTELEDEPPWARITPEQHRAAVAQLPAELREAYQLKALERLTYQEIGQRLGIAAATVGTRLVRARRQLKALLKPGLGHSRRAVS